jgi:hypothetical protein
MNRERKILLDVTILVIAFSMAGVSGAAPMGTAFTYQGHLVDANSPAEGLYDFEFEVYDTLDGGGQQGSTVSKDDVDVLDSYFTVELDFGSSVFTGDARWLQVAVRRGASSDPYDFATLSPRQKITPTPYAMHSGNADTLDMFDSSAFASSGHDHDSDYALISHIHDDRYYTETELGSSGSASVHWDNLTSVPAGLDDGDDVGITVETDPTVLASVKDGVSWSEVSSRPAGLDDGDDVGITVETDPTVLASVKDGVSWSEVSSRPAGLDDGDDVGITVETDPQVGSNTTNYLPKWNGSALVAGTVYDNGDVGIGDATPSDKLDVAGHINSSETYKLHGDTVLSNTGTYNIFVGEDAGVSNTIGEFDTFVGRRAGWKNTEGTDNTFVGSNAGLWNTTGNYNTFVGRSAGQNGLGSGNVFIGYRAGIMEFDSNKLYIANSEVNPPLIYGDFSTGQVGIGTTAPVGKLTVEGALGLDEIAAPSATSGYGKIYVKSTDSSLYFKDDGGTEYDLTTGGDDFVVGDFLICANDTLRVHSITGYVKLKETKIGRGGTLRIKFDLNVGSPGGVWVYAQIRRNGLIVGTTRSAISTSFVTYSEDISGWSKGDLVQIYGYTTNSSYPVYVRNFRLYADNPAEAGARF